jgi:hypothetical protein
VNLFHRRIEMVNDQAELPEIPETPEVPEIPEIPEAPEVPEVPEIPETPDVPEVPDENPDITIHPNPAGPEYEPSPEREPIAPPKPPEGWTPGGPERGG